MNRQYSWDKENGILAHFLYNYLMTDTLTGIVIKKIQFNSDDEIITLLTPEEVITFIALGTRKINSKNRVALDYGNLITAEIFRARLNNKISKLKKAVVLKRPPIKVSDTANVVADIVKHLSKLENPSPKLFEAIVKSYAYFGDTYNHHIKTYILFKSLYSLGIYPSTTQCVECGRTDRIVGFDYKDGGYKCSWHAQFERPLDELKAIKNLDKGLDEYKVTDPALNKKLYKELIYIINQYLFVENN